MARLLFTVMVFASLFLIGFGASFYITGRRIFREQGMTVAGWLVVVMMFIGAERAALCYARWERRHGVR